MTRSTVVLLVVLCAACSGLDKIETATCGNGIIEPGEDCDSELGCRQCGIECIAAALPDGRPTCPTEGFTCGADGLCHAPSGRFRAESAALPFQVQGFGATDVNGDGYDDVVALGGTSMTVHFGDAAGRLETISTTIIPFVRGAPAVTHLDPDTTLDIVIPTSDGLVAYTSPFHILSPYAFPDEIDSRDPARPKPLDVFTLDANYVGLLVNDGGALGIVIIDGNKAPSDMMMMPTVTPVCPGFPIVYNHDRVDTYDTATTHLVALASPTGAMCEIELKAATLPAYTIASAYHADANLFSRPVLARLGLSPCPSVVGAIGSPTGPVKEYLPSGTPGSCAVSTAVTMTNPRTLPSTTKDVSGMDAPLGTPRGHVPLQPAILNRGPDALAYEGGVVAVDTNSPAGAQTLFISARSIAEIRALDVDGDGKVDAVTSSPIFDDLDVLHRYSTGGDGFLAVGIDTLGVPRNLVVGDFDGDGLDDITYTEKLTDSERLMVTYGSRDLVGPPTIVSTYTDVMATGAIRLVSSADPTSRVLDLFVLDSVYDQGQRVDDVELLSTLLGSPQRTLTPFYNPRTLPVMVTGQIVGAVSGVFGTTPGKYQDLLTIEVTNSGRAWLNEIEPTEFGAMSPKTFAYNDALQPCFGQPGVLLCLDKRVEYVAWRPRADAPYDLVLADDSAEAQNLIVLDPHTPGGGTPEHLSMAALGVEPMLTPHPMKQGDFDGDGTLDVVLAYGPTTMPTPTLAGHVFTCTHDGSLACSELVVPELADWTCLDATPADVTLRHYGDPALPVPHSQDLALLCRSGKITRLYRVFHDDTGYHGAPLLELPATAYDVRMLDVTGDGVEDVLVRDSSAVLHVFPQCTSREANDCADPAGTR